MKSEIKMVSINDVVPYENNPRNNKQAIKYVANSIREFGFQNPIIVDKNGVIIAGHTRLEAAKKLKLKQVPVIYADDLNEEQVAAYRLADNKTAEKAEWDFPKLELELGNILSIDMQELGFDCISPDDGDGSDTKYSGENNGKLSERFIAPPFSVLSERGGEWSQRKKLWNSLGLSSGLGRGEGLLGDGLNKLAKAANMNLTGTSVFDPVLCEIIYKWFCPENGSVYDCFAGGSVRGVVAATCGVSYTGIDLRQEQIDENNKQWGSLEIEGPPPVWICDDSQNADRHIDDSSVDLLFSCPPYADLEKYSDDPRDISNMEYDDFIKAYSSIIETACRKVKDDRFAVFVVGDVRDKKGFYRDFVGDTKRIFSLNGFRLYNDIILVEQLGTAAIRAGRQFSGGRKVVKCHQNVLCFYRGDPKKIKQNYGEINVSTILNEIQDGIEE